MTIAGGREDRPYGTKEGSPQRPAGVPATSRTTE
jgi:hypothetical protein